MKHDIESNMGVLRQNNKDTVTYCNDMQTEVNKLYKLMISIIEVHYIESLLQIQDEGDRNSMSLFGVNERKENKLQSMLATPTVAKKASMAKEPYIEIDGECLSCSLEKYRPMIKEAFKMACVQYKPSGIPFRGDNFKRSSLIEIKEAVLMDSWLNAIQDIKYYREIYGA